MVRLLIPPNTLAGCTKHTTLFLKDVRPGVNAGDKGCSILQHASKSKCQGTGLGTGIQISGLFSLGMLLAWMCCCSPRHSLCGSGISMKQGPFPKAAWTEAGVRRDPKPCPGLTARLPWVGCSRVWFTDMDVAKVPWPQGAGFSRVYSEG